MRNFFGFMDETGVLANDHTQPYFALGLLRLNDTSKLLQKITTIKARHKGIINSINKNNNFTTYKSLNLILSHKANTFHYIRI